MQPQLPILLPPFLPPAFRPLVERILIPDGVLAHVEAAREAGSGVRFAAGLLDSLGIRFEADPRDLARVPASGPVVAIANHPYGIVEGLILMTMLDRVRPDCKILANSLLAGVPEIRTQTILVNPFLDAAPENLAPLRDAVAWLGRGGLLSIFPAGEVAHTTWTNPTVTDPRWKTTAVRLALRARCPVLPILFEGYNGLAFQLAGVFHPALRTFSLPREFYKLRGSTVRLRIGSPIPQALLSGHAGPDEATRYLRARTYFLWNRHEPAPLSRPAPAQRPRVVAPPRPEALLAAEIAALPAECELTGNRDFRVYLARAAQIPALLTEIGRSRELAFRAVGEGTGRDTDLDRFDSHYLHLILWSQKDGRLAGSYRLAFTGDVLPERGAAGLYTNTLFRFRKPFFDRLGPALELGRSFILPEYQRSYYSLMLLWKGILLAVARRPEVHCLFGAVSISRAYSDPSRQLLAAWLERRASHSLARFIAPRSPFRTLLRGYEVDRLAAAAPTFEDISAAIADIEPDSKGAPVLLRHYLKTGGRLLALNVDRRFAGVLDALLLLDLEASRSRVLDRCLVTS
jgi:putative hemolysin